MPKPLIKEHNASTDEVVEREMTDGEYAQFLADKELAEAKQEAILEKEARKLALLEKLGISEEEAKILLS